MYATIGWGKGVIYMTLYKVYVYICMQGVNISVRFQAVSPQPLSAEWCPRPHY